VIKIGLLGANGRMGQWVSKLLTSEFSDRSTLKAQVSQGDPVEPLLETDVIIDFSSPEGVLRLNTVALSKKMRLPAFVIGSTGRGLDAHAKLEELATLTPVLVSSNFSTGTLALAQILKTSAPLLKKLGYTPVIVETHHHHKKDAPSGTALALQRILTSADHSIVQTHSVRAGEIIGNHEITFYGTGDHITLGHFAQDRSIFARGAIEVALWLTEKQKHPSGAEKKLLSMDDFFRDRFLDV
jgi:4-hydroxy-tetrahydrodipicolinate reductase